MKSYYRKFTKIRKNSLKIIGIIFLIIFLIPSVTALQKTYNIYVKPSFINEDNTEILYINSESQLSWHSWFF
jgi:hypothetical protein